MIENVSAKNKRKSVVYWCWPQKLSVVIITNPFGSQFSEQVEEGYVSSLKSNISFLLVGRMDQNMNFKERWVYEEKVSSFKNGYKSYIFHICKPDLALNNP